MPMAILEGVSDSAVFLIAIVLVAVAWMIKLAYELKHAILQKSHSLDHKISSLEGKAVSIRREVVDLQKNVNQKLDREDLEKQLDSVIRMVGKKKETEKKKDMK